MNNLNLISRIAMLSKRLAEEELSDDDRDDLEAELYELQETLEEEEDMYAREEYS